MCIWYLLTNILKSYTDKSKKDGDGSSIHSHIYQIARLTILAMKNFHTNKSILNRGCLVLRNLSLTPAFVKILARTPGCVDMLLHCRQMCPRDVLVQRSARTIMILVQRVTEKKENDKDIFKLTQPTTLGSSMAAASGSSSFALSTATSRANSRASSSTPASMPKLGPRESWLLLYETPPTCTHYYLKHTISPWPCLTRHVTVCQRICKNIPQPLFLREANYENNHEPQPTLEERKHTRYNCYLVKSNILLRAWNLSNLNLALSDNGLVSYCLYPPHCLTSSKYH